jgi:hypothetical protein
MKVSAFIAYHLKTSRKTHVEIAREVGFSSSNTLSMLKNGTMKIPLNRVPALAEALGISAQNLFLRCLEEYMPDLSRTIKLILPGVHLSQEDVDTIAWLKAMTPMSFPLRAAPP